MRVMNYEDEKGYPRRVQLPEGVTEDDADLGIPLSVDWEALPFEESLRVKLAQELARRGFYTRQDFHKPNTVQAIQAALMSVLKTDAQTIHRLLVFEGSIENEPGNSGQISNNGHKG